MEQIYDQDVPLPSRSRPQSNLFIEGAPAGGFCQAGMLRETQLWEGVHAGVLIRCNGLMIPSE